MVASGSCFGWVTPILNHLLGPDSEIPMTPSQASWMISIIELGNLLSPLPAGFLSDKFGRKSFIVLCAPIYISSWLIILYCRTFLALCVARVIQGLAMGIAFTVVPVYLGEIAHPKSRGAITSIFFNAWWFGFLFEYCTGPFLSYRNFTYLTLSVPLLCFMLFIWQPESPYYYLMKSNEEKAYASLAWFRNESEPLVREELQEIKYSMKQDLDKNANLRDLVATPVDRRALNIIMIFGAVRIMSGAMPITTYATQIFENIPNSVFPPDYITIVMGVIMLVGGICGTITTDVFGRRPLLLISCVGSFLSTLSAGIYFYLQSNTALDVSRVSWIAPVSILIYCGISVAGMYPVNVCYISELFNTKTRGIASSISAIIITIGSFVSLKLYQTINDNIGVYFNFFMFAAICLFGCVTFYIIMPETKGRSFPQIRKELYEAIKKSNESIQSHDSTSDIHISQLSVCDTLEENSHR